MFKKLFLAVLLTLFFISLLNAEITPLEIINKTDSIRNPDKPFSSIVTITEYQQAKPKDSMVVKIRSKQSQNNGQFRTLISFHKPIRDRGKLMLRNGNEVWFYDPDGKSSVRISPQQRLLGQASNGDIMTANFSLDYDSALIGIDSIQDADRQQRQTWHLKMTAKPEAKELAYSSIEYWVDKSNFHPIMGRFYSESGRLLKQAYYRGYKKILGQLRPTEVIIIDGVDTSKVTRMSFSDYEYVEIPEQWLQRGYLPHFKSE